MLGTFASQFRSAGVRLFLGCVNAALLGAVVLGKTVEPAGSR
jgi:hypothetical protein